MLVGLTPLLDFIEKYRKAMAGAKIGRISTASFRGERADATVRLPSGFSIQEGAQLSETCFVGKLLGEGIQVRTPVLQSAMLNISRLSLLSSQRWTRPK